MLFADLTSRRSLRAILAVAGLTLVTACGDDDPTDPDDDPGERVASLRLTVTPPSGAAATYTLTPNGSTPSPVQLRVGTSTLAVVALDNAGAAVNLGNEFELQMKELPAGVTFTPNGTFTVPITATTATSAPKTVRADMWHKGEGHEDFTALFPLTVAP